MWPSQIITDYHEKRNIFSGETYLTICVEWASDHFGLRLTKLIHFLTKIRMIKQFFDFHYKCLSEL